MMSIPPVKDEEREHPIATSWRETIREIVYAFAQGDFELSRQAIASVAPVHPQVAKQMQDYVQEYGETLSEVQDETWSSSVAQWMTGHWEALVDLWTEESGESDLVLSLKVFEDGDGYRFEILSLSVP